MPRARELSAGVRLIEDVRAALRKGLGACGFDDADAALLATALARDLQRKWHGQRLYIPFRMPGDIAARNASICAEFTGRNLKRLCAKYALGETQLRKILSAGRRHAGVARPTNSS